MARTTEAEVREIYSTHPSGTDLTGVGVAFYIEAANEFVTTHLGASGFAADKLRRIEALVACHLIGGSDPLESEGSIGDESTTFEGADITGPGLKETRFGRRAITLSNGKLATVGAGAPSSFTFGGASYDSQAHR